jgi:hypothetical protein
METETLSEQIVEGDERPTQIFNSYDPRNKLGLDLKNSAQLTEISLIMRDINSIQSENQMQKLITKKFKLI